jgi:2-polyprenyl-3-methyl-5-hydroxy-6-metoxy-1,4-benzoquinol methylase
MLRDLKNRKRRFAPHRQPQLPGQGHKGFPSELVCCNHSEYALEVDRSAKGEVAHLICPKGCRYPIIKGIPRFVTSDKYAASFGLQWNTFRTTQFDSLTGCSISRDRLTRMLGDSLEILKEKDVLEAGCGAGRFTEIMLQAGARVFAVDLSSAVEANYENFSQYPNHFVCQADILDLPVRKKCFDIVLCIGVVQHTPNPEATMRTLCSYVKPGGLLVLDHYTYGYAVTASRKILRRWFLRLSPTASFLGCRVLVALLWPVHVILYKYKHRPLAARVRSRFLRYSPVVDYHDAYGQIGTALLRQWALLDTHDTLTDAHKHLRSAAEIEICLTECGLTDIETAYAGNGVEARARKPKHQKDIDIDRKAKSA